MNNLAEKALKIFAATGLFLSSPAYADQQSTPAPIAGTQVPAAEKELGGPALWKLADEDTTIYLFGTVHALPPEIEWFDETLAGALAQSDTIVTEILVDDALPAKMQSLVTQTALLPQGTSLESLMGPDQRQVYEAAMGKLGLQANAFDPFEPWFVGMTMSVVPLIQQGYSADLGVEKILLKNADGKEHLALETIEQQIGFFDTLPQESQLQFLIGTAENIDQIKPMLDAMVAEWLEGDAEQLAELMNQGLDDQVLANALLYQRNEAWAKWLQARLDMPGTVFVAVGAGHLAGVNSVQDYTGKLGLEITRIR